MRFNLRNSWPDLLAGTVMVLILCAGVLKALDLSAFAAAVKSWWLLPAGIRPLVVLAIPAIEICISLLWLLGMGRRASIWMAVALITSGTMMYGAHVLWGETPECGCFGVALSRHALVTGWPGVVARNLIFLVMLVPSLKGVRPEDRGPSSARVPAGARSGWTLIETIVAVALVGVLLSLSVPQLARVRTAGWQAKDLSNLRSHAGVFTSYTVDYEDLFPYPTDPQATYSILRCGDLAVRVEYFAAGCAWQIALADPYYGGNAVHPSFESPFWPERVSGPRVPTLSPYLYPCSFIARPEFWDPLTRGGSAQWKPTRADEVTWPTQKSLLFNVNAFNMSFGQDPNAGGYLVQVEPWWTNTAMVDGSAMRTSQGMGIGKQLPCGQSGLWGSIHTSPQPFLDVAQGVRGRDVVQH